MFKPTQGVTDWIRRIKDHGTPNKNDPTMTPIFVLYDSSW